MNILVVGAVPFGMILGKFFKWYVLIPACGLAIVLVLVFPAHTEPSLMRWFLQIYIVITSLQIGYAVGLFARDFMPCRIMICIRLNGIFISISLLPLAG